MKYYYKVAEHTFSVEMPERGGVIDEMGQYAPFSVSEAPQVVFSLRVVGKDEFPAVEGVVTEMNQDDDGSQILVGRLQGKSYFEFQLWGRCAARMITDDSYQHADVLLVDEPLFGINNALMVMYALSTANLQTALFHSSVVSYEGYGYMFLGKSGTGKSTHSSLWLKHISGTELINDDNPVVRRLPDGFYVFGSPWSGKTPCYRNVRYPLGGVVQLSQAPYNRIQRLSPLAAYAALVPSISGKRWDKLVAEGLHQTEEMMAGEVAVWHLECLPDEAAAQLCSETIRKA
ncbi:MAG: hypothetical protein K6F43_09080 [Prevotella sp.]|nr:hypothetical protein [Prevotella sp.]